MFSFINPIEWFAGIPPEWAVFWTSMIPITEIRASIPIGLEYYHLPIVKTWLISVVGDIIPAIILLAILPIMNTWMQKNKFLGDILSKELKKAEKKFSGKYFKYGAVALILFVGIPLPFTGSWTGSLASFVFNIPFKKSMPLITAGVMLAATVITIITLFAGGTIRLLFGL
jgi:uncharacterized membrane protein